jgi:macrolide transport system ATP-binding/permease protein
MTSVPGALGGVLIGRNKAQSSHENRLGRGRLRGDPFLMSRPHVYLIKLLGLIVPRKLRSGWRQEWEAELQHREVLLAEWDRLNFRTKLYLFRCSLGAFSDALWLQQFRLEDEMLQDLRYGVRMLLKNKGFAAVAVLSLALGTGANTAIFSIVNAGFLRPLPISEPEQLVALNNVADNRPFPTFSYPNYKDFRDRCDAFSDLIAYRFTSLSLSHDGQNDRLWGYEVSGNYFEALGIQAAIGRLISVDDDRIKGASPVSVISFKCWRQRFGGTSEVVGKNVIVNGRGYTIIGVAPPDFFGTEVVSSPEMWFPMSMQAQIETGNDWLDDREAENVFVQGRLKPGIGSARAQASLNDVAEQLEREHPTINEGKRVTLSPPGMIGVALRGPVLGFAGLLMLVVGLVMLLACTNLSNLLLARATERRREIAVRLALGATRFRLVRQLLTESVLLAFGGGALGLLFAVWLVGLVAKFKPPINVPLSFNVQIDFRVFLFTILVSLATGVLFGLLPALQATKADVAPALKLEVSSTGRRRSYLKSGLIVLQVTLSLVLLVAGGLMLRALRQAQSVELGFTPQRAVEVSFDLRLQGYERSRYAQFQKRLLDRVRSLPGVEAAGIADIVPVDLHFSRDSVFVEGRLPDRPSNTPRAFFNRITPGYFSAMNTRIVAGRDFNEHDEKQSLPVAIVNESFARRFWPGDEAIGKRFSLGSPGSPKVEIVGVVQDGKYAGLNEDGKPYVCRPLWQAEAGSSNVIVRGGDDVQRLIGAVTREVLELDPHLPISSDTMTGRMDLPLLPVRIAASLLGGFGVLALALAAIGLYGVMSYAVTRRTHEIGIRMALGAQRRDVLRLVMGHGLLLTIIGMLIGLGAASTLTRLMKSLLFGVSATDTATFLVTALVLGFVAVLASYLPARRATRVDPIVALHYE